jgi:AraC-like DNA-binding protein
MYADHESEQRGSIGASVAIGSDHETLALVELVNGRHYRDGGDLLFAKSALGDGSETESVGEMTWDGTSFRVDRLSIDVPAGPAPTSVTFRDLGTPASFVLFDVVFEFAPGKVCPFDARGGGVPLSELGGLVRVRDRVRLSQALRQMETGVAASSDLDEARGEALTFVAVLTAATLEMGAERSMHRVQLDLSRQLEALDCPKKIALQARKTAESMLNPILEKWDASATKKIDSALAYVGRNFALPLTDASVAQELDLSTSHFRFLFKQVTSRPFHQYLLAVRLERARVLLAEGLSVGEAAEAVGFRGLSHFSRAFSRRFAMSPSQARRAVQ